MSVFSDLIQKGPGVLTTMSVIKRLACFSSVLWTVGSQGEMRVFQIGCLSINLSLVVPITMLDATLNPHVDII